MAFFLAIDNGGTKTDYVLADEAHTLARVRTGTIKRMRVDAATATVNLEAALAELTEKSGVSMQTITCTCIGTAGQTVPLVTDWLRREIGSRVSGNLLLLGDVEIALDAAFPGAAGVLVLAGTGSNIAGRATSGEMVGSGGWGPALADQGSGHRIGLQALRRLVRAVDEGHPTLILEAVLAFWKLRDLDHLVAFANELPAPDFSELSELTLRCADAGDTVALSVLQQEGEDLGNLVRLVIRKILTAEKTADAALPAIAFAGSIMENVQPVRDALVRDVRREFPAIRALDGVIDPIEGALWRARNYESSSAVLQSER